MLSTSTRNIFFSAKNFGFLSIRSFSTTKYTLPDMPYDYGALEPHISGKIMELHHAKHHQTYVNNLNAALEQHGDLFSGSAQDTKNVSKLITLQQAVKFNGGGHINHSLFWKCMCPGGKAPSGSLLEKIEHVYGSFDKFKAEFTKQALAVQGSGWTWLAVSEEGDKKERLKIVSCKDQDPCITTGCQPLIGVDVWEHAYYIDYQNRRPDYLKAVFNVLNFDFAQKQYDAITSKKK